MYDLIIIPLLYLFLLCIITFLCGRLYYIYNCRPPTGQVPIEERCVIEKEYLNSYAKEK